MTDERRKPINAAEMILWERTQPHHPSCMILHGDVVCSCGNLDKRAYDAEHPEEV